MPSSNGRSAAHRFADVCPPSHHILCAWHAVCLVADDPYLTRWLKVEAPVLRDTPTGLCLNCFRSAHSCVLAVLAAAALEAACGPGNAAYVRYNSLSKTV